MTKEQEELQFKLEQKLQKSSEVIDQIRGIRLEWKIAYRENDINRELKALLELQKVLENDKPSNYCLGLFYSIIFIIQTSKLKKRVRNRIQQIKPFCKE